ncbi:MAG: c-type cytochrome [Gammaproteobacteria bacterium]
MSNHDDAVFVRNFSLVLVGLAIVGILAFILAKVVNRNFEASQSPNEMVQSRIAPMGQVNTSGETMAMESTAAVSAPTAEAAPVAAGDLGKSTYNSVCFACHAQGIAGAPKYGDATAWADRLAKGRDTNVANAINGFTGSAGLMPAKGGNPALSDEAVAAAVDYMLEAAGGEAAPTAEPAAAAPSADAAVEEAAATTADSGRGKEVYDAACFVCHTPGAAGAPKLGDGTAWGPRIEKGVDALYNNSINGFMGSNGMMPPKGGRPDFSDEDVKAAVDFMVSEAQ